ncbi:MAG: hypothetical protein ABSH28_22645 [Acidobacteriota bacterium]|jgi:hypothetical protein
MPYMTLRANLDRFAGEQLVVQLPILSWYRLIVGELCLTDQFAAAGDFLSAIAIAQQAVGAWAHETLAKHMRQRVRRGA